MKDINGLKVFVNSLATEQRVHFDIVRNAIRKRRKNYRVVKRVEHIPTAYQVAGMGLVVHPEIYKKLKGATQ